MLADICPSAAILPACTNSCSVDFRTASVFFRSAISTFRLLLARLNASVRRDTFLSSSSFNRRKADFVASSCAMIRRRCSTNRTNTVTNAKPSPVPIATFSAALSAGLILDSVTIFQSVPDTGRLTARNRGPSKAGILRRKSTYDANRSTTVPALILFCSTRPIASSAPGASY